MNERFAEIRARVKSRYADKWGALFREDAPNIRDLETLLCYIDMGERAVPVVPPPEGPWRTTEDGGTAGNRRFVVYNPAGQTGTPQFNRLLASEALLIKDALNSVRGVRPLAPEEPAP